MHGTYMVSGYMMVFGGSIFFLVASMRGNVRGGGGVLTSSDIIGNMHTGLLPMFLLLELSEYDVHEYH